MIRPEMFVETKASKTPLLDYVERVTANVDYSDYAQISVKKRLMYLTLKTPLLANMLWDIAEDVVGSIDFIPLGRGNGKRRVQNTRSWARRVKFTDHLKSVVFDILSTGEGYTYLGASASALREEIDRMPNEAVRDRLFDEAIIEPKFRSVSSITMTNDHNATNLVKYTQRVSGSETVYAPKEIIHSYFKRRSGKIDGFSPVSTMGLQIELMWLMWTNQYDLQAKGNMPDMFVVAEEIKSNTPVLKELEQKLRKYNMPGSAKHGTTVLYGGKYNFQMMERDTSLQFEDVGKAVTTVIANAYRYPSHRLGIKTKEGAADKDTQGNSDRDYWNLISKWQDVLAEDFDTQLFEPFFGVQIIFDKTYLHDSVVENTAVRGRIDNINMVNSLLMQHKKRITMDDALSFISGKRVDYDIEDIPEEDIPKELPQIPGMQSDPKQKDQELSKRKKQEQAAQEKNTGGQTRF